MNTTSLEAGTKVHPRLSPLRIALAIALVASATLFAVGVNTERSGHGESSEAGRQPVAHSESAETHSESGETAGESAAPKESASEATKKVLGIDTESDTMVWLVVIVSVSLALGVLVFPKLAAFVWAAVAFSLAAAVFDSVEISRQISRSDAGLAVLAALIALIHLVAVALGIQIQRQHV